MEPNVLVHLPMASKTGGQLNITDQALLSRPEVVVAEAIRGLHGGPDCLIAFM